MKITHVETRAICPPLGDYERRLSAKAISFFLGTSKS